jgi:hypothetical protein
VLGKFHREASPGRAVQPAEEPLHDAFGDYFQTTELRHLNRIEQVQAGTACGKFGALHGTGNVSVRDG